MSELLYKIREINGVSIIAHPYREMMEFPLLDRFERLTGYTAVEGINGANTPAENERVIRIMNNRSHPYTGGSDAHKPQRVGSAYTRFYDRIENINDLMIQLKSGRFSGHLKDSEP